MKDFKSLGLSGEILKVLPELGIYKPTEIQHKAIPHLASKTKDFVGIAQTGTGKTATFSLPLLDSIDVKQKHVQALVLAPTRELCQQIAQQVIAFSEYLPGIRTLAVYGGASISQQIRALKQPTQIIIATPGRLLDLIKRKKIRLDQLSHLILDEADEMLNMGFKEDLDAILSYMPSDKSTWLFSATMPKEIRRIISKYMDKSAIEVRINAGQLINENIEHQFIKVKTSEKTEVIKRLLDADPDMRGIIFCRTKAGTRSLAETLRKAHYQVDALHGDMNQSQRDRVMKRFKAYSLKVIVATDVAARGIDVNDLTHIIHHNLPDDFDYYTHRSGRTARAGKKGISLALISGKDNRRMSMLEKKLNIKFKPIPVPAEEDIIINKILGWAEGIAKVELPEKSSKKLMGKVSKILGDFSKDELIQKVIAKEIGWPEDRKAKPIDRKSRSRKQREIETRSEPKANMDRFFINVGTIDKVKRRDLLEFICDQANLKKTDVGNIELKSKHSFFEVDRKYSKRISSSFKGFDIDGRPLRVNRDNPKKKRQKHY